MGQGGREATSGERTGTWSVRSPQADTLGSCCLWWPATSFLQTGGASRTGGAAARVSDRRTPSCAARRRRACAVPPTHTGSARTDLELLARLLICKCCCALQQVVTRPAAKLRRDGGRWPRAQQFSRAGAGSKHHAYAHAIRCRLPCTLHVERARRREDDALKRRCAAPRVEACIPLAAGVGVGASTGVCGCGTARSWGMQAQKLFTQDAARHATACVSLEMQAPGLICNQTATMTHPCIPTSDAENGAPVLLPRIVGLQRNHGAMVASWRASLQRAMSGSADSDAPTGCSCPGRVQ